MVKPNFIPLPFKILNLQGKKKFYIPTFFAEYFSVIQNSEANTEDNVNATLIFNILEMPELKK
jgi:hypothetical protein